jgi:hypothetical protein
MLAAPSVLSSFSKSVFPAQSSKTCGFGVWVSSFAWPYNVGRELARWSYEKASAILKIGRKLGIGTSVVRRVLKQEPWQP